MAEYPGEAGSTLLGRLWSKTGTLWVWQSRYPRNPLGALECNERRPHGGWRAGCSPPFWQGGLIGLERSFRGRPAGFRTHTLVCLASTVLMLVTVYEWQWFQSPAPDSIRMDPTRMAQGIMTGIGLLGAGVIFKEGITVPGLTTAASIWITAAFGILIGIGFHFPATVTTALVIFVLSIFRWIESHMRTQNYARLAQIPDPGSILTA